MISASTSIIHLQLDRSQTSAKIGDFGLAQTKNTLSLISKVAGTFNWMAPEVMQDKPHNEKADIYSLGMVLYEMAPIKFHLASAIKCNCYSRL